MIVPQALPRASSTAAATATAARALLGAAALALASLGVLACAEEAPVQQGPATPSLEAGEQGKLDKGRKKIDGANRAIAEKKYDRARKLLHEAAELSVESQRFEIEEATEKLDKREAKLWSNELSDRLKEKDCAGAVKEVSAKIKELASETFTKEIRRLLGPSAQKCIETELDDKVLASAYADARKLATGPEVKPVLGPGPAKKLAAELETTILDALRGQIADDLKARKWAAVVDKIDQAAKKGDATEEQAAQLMASVRTGIAPEIIAAAQRALGQREAPQALKQIDAQIQLVRWEAMAPDAAALAKDKALPEDVARKREALAIWVEAQRVGLKVLKKPEKRWAHGKIRVAPPARSDGDSKRDIAHGAEVWVLGTTTKGERALLTDRDPGAGPLTAMFDKVVGWAPMDRLAKEATADWVVPDDQLKGELVWAPLRKDEPLWELGLVTEVAGKDISVKRIADDAVIKVSRRQLRTGRLAPGTRIITFCTGKDQPAKIDEVLPNRSVKIKCDSGQEKEEVLASLRTKPELLPATK